MLSLVGSCERYVRALLPYLRLARLMMSAQVLITRPCAINNRLVEVETV
jgi:hypothetical protein